jgi:hypothetical protein
MVRGLVSTHFRSLVGAMPPVICADVSVVSVWRVRCSLPVVFFFMAMCFAKVNKKWKYKKAGNAGVPGRLRMD